MTGVLLKFDKRFKNRTKARFEKTKFEVGILRDKAYRDPRSKKAGHTTISGMKARKRKATSSTTIARVSRWLRIRTNFLRAPFEKTRSKEMRILVRSLQLFINKKITPGTLKTAIEQVVLRPFNRKAYGGNAPSTIRTKGFSRMGLDTGQVYQNIKARIVK